MKRRIRRYRSRLRKKILILSSRLLNLFASRTSPRITHGNRVRLVESGPEAYELLIRLIRQARSTIDLEYYIFRDDYHGSGIAEELIKKAREGVRVSVIYDYIGCIDTKSEFFAYLCKHGVRAVPFNPIRFPSNPLLWDRRDHRKVAIFDGETAIVSGWNIGSEYFRTADHSMRDAGVMIEGPCARVLQRNFCEIFSKITGKRLTPRRHGHVAPSGEDEVWMIESGPGRKFKAMYNAYRLAIMAAKKMVWIENAYFIPPRRLRNALVNAVNRGVDVRIVLPDEIDVPVVKFASYNFFRQLLRAGVRIFERKRMILHSKVACVDDVWVTVGSTNLHRRSFEKNYELNIVVISERFGAEVKRFISNDIDHSGELTLREWNARPLFQRILERLAAVLSIFL